jgi:hypothetical protein
MNQIVEQNEGFRPMKEKRKRRQVDGGCADGVGAPRENWLIFIVGREYSLR